jgi:hypothetical protein
MLAQARQTFFAGSRGFDFVTLEFEQGLQLLANLHFVVNDENAAL